MRRAQASIAMLLVYVGLMAVGLAALRVSSRLWASVAFSLALTLLLVSIAGMIYRRGPRKAFWAGFALWGWSYLVLAFGPAPLNAWRDLLVTVPLLSMLEERLLNAPNSTAPASRPATAPNRPNSRATPYVELSPWTYWTATDRSNPFSSDSFYRIGHALFCIGIAVGGGAFCRFLYKSRDESSPSS